MRGDPPISSIYRMAGPATPPDPDRIHAKIWRWYRDLWTKHDTIAFKLRDLPEHLRKPLIELANETYGEQKHDKR